MESVLVYTMLTLALLVTCLGGLASSAPGVFYNINEAEIHFEGFMKTYSKNYSSEQERQMRFEVFKQNLEIINERNEMEEEAVHGVTMFSDLTYAEFESMYLGLRIHEGPGPCGPRVAEQLNYAAPDKFDWRDKKIVTAVKNQGKCGSCWAFSTAGNIESQYAIKTGKLLELSKSQMVDCDQTNNGCDGGYPYGAILYVQKAGGIMTEADYPYRGKAGSCAFKHNKVAVKVKGCYSYTFKNEDELKETLISAGPLSIAVATDGWTSYRGGIFSNCRPNQVNHAVLLVGYGTENGTPYWVIKNSWGTSWGESGYIRVKRNVDCSGILSSKMIATAIVE